jgi:hypothetical protein
MPPQTAEVGPLQGACALVRWKDRHNRDPVPVVMSRYPLNRLKSLSPETISWAETGQQPKEAKKSPGFSEKPGRTRPYP